MFVHWGNSMSMIEDYGDIDVESAHPEGASDLRNINLPDLRQSPIAQQLSLLLKAIAELEILNDFIKPSSGFKQDFLEQIYPNDKKIAIFTTYLDTMLYSGILLLYSGEVEILHPFYTQDLPCYILLQMQRIPDITADQVRLYLNKIVMLNFVNYVMLMDDDESFDGAEKFKLSYITFIETYCNEIQPELTSFECLRKMKKLSYYEAVSIYDISANLKPRNTKEQAMQVVITDICKSDWLTKKLSTEKKMRPKCFAELPAVDEEKVPLLRKHDEDNESGFRYRNLTSIVKCTTG